MPKNTSDLLGFFSTQYSSVWELEEADALNVKMLMDQTWQRHASLEQQAFGQELLNLSVCTFIYEIAALFTQTSFVQKVIVEDVGNGKQAFPVEQLEKAFWNGMLNQLLPQHMLPKQRRKLENSFWQIRTNECSLFIDMAEAPEFIHDSCSISPYLFFSTANMN